MSRKKQDEKDDVETVHDKAEIEAALADTEAGDGEPPVPTGEPAAEAELLDRIAALETELTECRQALDNPERKQTRRKKAKRDVLGVHDFWDGYEQALRDKAHRADGIEYVGRQGETLSQALHQADIRRKAQVAEAEADTK